MFGWSKSFCFRVRKFDYVIPYYVIANFVFEKWPISLSYVKYAREIYA